MWTRTPTGRPGVTLLELVVAIALLSALGALGLPPFRALQDRLAAEGAAAVTVRAMTDARHHAVRRGARTALLIDTSGARLTTVAARETVAVHALRASFGVSVATTRDSIAWTPVGLGYGAANARVILTRGAAAETVTVSRLGRVRR